MPLENTDGQDREALAERMGSQRQHEAALCSRPQRRHPADEWRSAGSEYAAVA